MIGDISPFGAVPLARTFGQLRAYKHLPCCYGLSNNLLYFGCRPGCLIAQEVMVHEIADKSAWDAKLEEAKAAGKIVVVDFTAVW